MIPLAAFKRFGQYAIVGVSTLALDLLMLAGMTELLHIPYFVSTPISFLIAVSINYALSRRFVFKGTQRALHHGYAYFIGIAAIAAVCITGAVAALVTYGHVEYLIARILVAGVVGIGNYLINLHFNFKVAGVHL